MIETLNNQPGIPKTEKREVHFREKEINISGMVYVNNNHASIRLTDERQGGLGGIISEQVKNKLNITEGQSITIKTIPPKSKKEIKMTLIVRHIEKTAPKKYKIGFQYVDGSEKLSLRSSNFTATA